MKDSDIYLLAAKKMEEGQASYFGYALDLVGQPNPGGSNSPLQEAVDDTFGYNECDTMTKDEAILVLLFMREIAKEKERK